MLDRLSKLLATGFGVGYLPKAPGTFGSMVGVGLWWGMAHISQVYLYTGLLLATVALAIACAGRAACLFQQTDPPCVVIDEIVAMPLVLINVGLNTAIWQVAFGFGLFRLFDIWKPFPVRQSQSLPGGLGIVMDDLLAAAYASVTLHIVMAGMASL